MKNSRSCSALHKTHIFSMLYCSMKFVLHNATHKSSPQTFWKLWKVISTWHFQPDVHAAFGITAVLTAASTHCQLTTAVSLLRDHLLLKGKYKHGPCYMLNACIVKLSVKSNCLYICIFASTDLKGFALFCPLLFLHSYLTSQSVQGGSGLGLLSVHLILNLAVSFQMGRK